MSIATAKRELYEQLKGVEGVTGAGITQKQGLDAIIIFLTKPKKDLSVSIPARFKGNKVVTEVRGMAKAKKAS